MAKTFKAVRVPQFGPADVMKVEDVPWLTPSKSQVLVKMYASGVNPVEIYIRSGNYGGLPTPPYTPGNDGAGIIEEVGDDVTHLKKGDKVYTLQTVTGSYAQYALCEGNMVFKFTADISFEQAAGLGAPYFTAYRALFTKGKVTPDDLVLIHGASGGVGIMALQLAKSRGIKTIGTAGSPEGLKLILEQGATHALNHNAPDHFAEIMKITDGKGVNFIFENLSNVNLGHDLTVLARCGRVAIVGARGNVEINPRDILGREAEVFGVALFTMSKQDTIEMVQQLDIGLANHSINPIIGKIFTLEQVVDAHKFVIPHDKPSSGATGKVVLKISHE